jgi:hypothetical protein
MVDDTTPASSLRWAPHRQHGSVSALFLLRSSIAGVWILVCRRRPSASLEFVGIFPDWDGSQGASVFTNDPHAPKGRNGLKPCIADRATNNFRRRP